MNSEITPSRPRNEVWDALEIIFGTPTTDTNRKLRGKITASLTRAGATEDEILRRASTWPHHFPGATLTETALEKHWDRLGRAPLVASEIEVQRLARQRERADLERWALEMEQEGEA